MPRALALAALASIALACSAQKPIAPKKVEAEVAPKPAKVERPRGFLVARGAERLVVCKSSDSSESIETSCKRVETPKIPAMQQILRDLSPRYLLPKTDGTIVFWSPATPNDVQPFDGPTYDVKHEQHVAYVLDDGSALSVQYASLGDEWKRWTPAAGWRFVHRAVERAWSFAFLGDGRHLYVHNDMMGGHEMIELMDAFAGHPTSLMYGGAIDAVPRVLHRGVAIYDPDFADEARRIVWMEAIDYDAKTDLRRYALMTLDAEAGSANAPQELARIELPTNIGGTVHRAPPSLRISTKSRWIVVAAKETAGVPSTLRAIDVRGELASVDHALADDERLAQPIDAGGPYRDIRRGSEAIIVTSPVPGSWDVELTVLSLPSFVPIARARLDEREAIDVDWVEE